MIRTKPQASEARGRSSRAIALPMCVVAALLLPQPARAAEPPAPEAKKQPPRIAIAGIYSVEGSTAEVSVKSISGDFFMVASSEGWEGVGILDGSIYHGVFRHRGGADAAPGAMGEHTIDWTDPEHPSMRAKYTLRKTGELAQRWRRVADKWSQGTEPPRFAPPEGRPEFGEYVYVEELPEAVTKVPPVYPEEARRAGVEGTVLVQALVLEDGTVGDTRIVKSMPPFDDAAVACVRQWRFKPALRASRPVAVWVAVPVRFTKQ